MLWRSGFDEPAAEGAGERSAAVLKVQAAFLPADDHGIAVQQGIPAGGTEGTDIFNAETAAVRPDDDSGLHKTGGIKIRRDFDIYPFGQKASLRL